MGGGDGEGWMFEAGWMGVGSFLSVCVVDDGNVLTSYFATSSAATATL